MKYFTIAIFVFSFNLLAQEVQNRPMSSDLSSPPKDVFAPSGINHNWRFSLALGYTLSNELEFGKYTISQKNPYVYGQGKISVKYDSNFLLGAFISKINKNSVGGIFGLNYYFSRDAQSYDLNMNNGYKESGSLSGNSSSKLESLIFDAAATYRWEQIYVLLGINYSKYKFTPASNSKGNIDVKGSLGGYFLGAGFFFDKDDKISAELQYRIEAIKLEGTSADGNIYEVYDDGKVKAINLLIKYHF